MYQCGNERGKVGVFRELRPQGLGLSELQAEVGTSVQQGGVQVLETIQFSLVDRVRGLVLYEV